MRMLQRCVAVVLIISCLLPMQNGIAELAPDRVEFYRERTEEWERALGEYARWDYYERAMFCAIYGRRPGDYLNDEGVQDRIPKFPPAECITYEEALIIAKTFLSEYEPRITEEYLSGLHVGSAYYDFWGDPLTTVTKKEHAQVWIIQFGEEHHSGEYIVRCDAYIDAITGRVVCIDIGIDMRYPNDWDNYTSIDFKNLMQ